MKRGCYDPVLTTVQNAKADAGHALGVHTPETGEAPRQPSWLRHAMRQRQAKKERGADTGSR
ncbi:MAG: hypothetical protein IAE79_28595 [Anaerolinea sp.]|nr:hypothetical protein [Anaerolinea sp.]